MGRGNSQRFADTVDDGVEREGREGKKGRRDARGKDAVSAVCIVVLVFHDGVRREGKEGEKGCERNRCCVCGGQCLCVVVIVLL